jgi:hypothetical protein
MNPPFTASQFLDVISQYNAAAWPAQVIFYDLAALTIYGAARPSQNRDRWVNGLAIRPAGYSGLKRNVAVAMGSA